nr:vesicle-fusing atpase [Quercus suber]
MAQPPATNIHCRNNTSTANQPPQLLTNMAISDQPKLQPKKKKSPQIEQIATKPIPFHSIQTPTPRPDPNKNQVSPSSTSMIMTNTPTADLALMNLVYCSHTDLHGFIVPSTKLYLSSIADSFVLSLTG